MGFELPIGFVRQPVMVLSTGSLVVEREGFDPVLDRPAVGAGRLVDERDGLAGDAVSAGCSDAVGRWFFVQPLWPSTLLRSRK
ncbi:hypothetical protein ACFC96_16235 [Streptomyces sp. NPDC055955]|uniref:hypothetical protein n=1 Tax=Streptomyces sp. NPDC055955 TaxID=3345665 RepID=UPI0035E1CB0D